jgi:anti-anti-sigma regulatory factor
MDGIALTRLDGEIRGGSEDFLQPLDEAAAGRSAVLIDLSALRRLDFASAGIVLNWVMAQSSAGRSVRFEGTHRLIAGLFAILGISSVAQVELRKT